MSFEQKDTEVSTAVLASVHVSVGTGQRIFPIGFRL